MSLIDFLKTINDEVKSVVASDFKIDVIETDFVPNFGDPAITYDNLDKKVKHCKRLKSCVLYVDIRNSASISAARQPQTLARLYSTFVRSMIAAARFYGGHVRNIIGDRVMVVFDKERCFTTAVDTAILMNSIAHYIINKHINSIDFKCGIGIDYGNMLIVKAGAIRRGEETEFYRSLVWLGRPANVASRLTDIANKVSTTSAAGIYEGYYYKNIDEWHWVDKTYEEFIDSLEKTYSPTLRHKDKNFSSFFKTTIDLSTTALPPILMTEEVYNGYKAESPSEVDVNEGWWREQTANISEYNGKIYGASVFRTAVQVV